ncbi:MAG TPA: biotin/lipoyl-binding protein [Vampirovibrionales bacterium]
MALILKSKSLFNTPSWVSKSYWGIIIITVLGLISLFVIPWQQTVLGSGKISSLNPENRSQYVEAPINGRIEKLHVTEGDVVKKGDVLVELSDLSKDFLANNLLDLNLSKVAFTKESIKSYENKIAFTNNEIEALQGNIANEIAVLEQEKLIAETDLETANLNLTRIKTLSEKGLSSEREKELVIQKRNNALAKLERAKAKISQKRIKMVQEIAKLNSNIQGYQADKAKLSGDLIQSEIKLQTAQKRREMGLVRAPYDGIIVRILKRGTGETFKENDQMIIMTPLTEDRAVELFLSDIDAPLVSVNDRVRLQFAGWPALQFGGFSDTLSFGTFPGRIAVVDNVDSGNGYFRVIVVPDESEGGWPPGEMLRMGTRASGWVILRTVTLGYELWRRFSGLPISVNDVSSHNFGTAYGPAIDKKNNQNSKKKGNKVYDRKLK